MLLKDSVRFQKAKSLPAAPPVGRSRSTRKHVLRAEPQSVSAPRVTIVAACCFHLIFKSLGCQRESERWAELSVTEFKAERKALGLRHGDIP